MVSGKRGLIRGLTLGVVLALGATSCGGGGGGGDGGGGGSVGNSGVVSCTLSEGVGGYGDLMICEEGPASARQQFQQACMSPGDAGAGVTAHLVDGPCSHVGALGGCRITAGGVTQSVWYYGDGSGLASSDVQMLCASIGATYVAP